jgi:hypothetical protein
MRISLLIATLAEPLIQQVFSVSHFDSPLSALNYGEEFAALWRTWDWRNGLRSQRSVDKLANGPSAINDAQRLRWRRLEGFMNTAQIVVGDVQRDRRNMVV